MNMDETGLIGWLKRFQNGAITLDGMLNHLKHLPYEDVGFARIDHHRIMRHGFPEVVFGRGKTSKQVATIAAAIIRRGHNLLVTHAEEEHHTAILEIHPDVVFHPVARCLTWRVAPEPAPRPGILIVTAGTADLPVAEEARVTAEMAGNDVELLADVGVAGLHRLLDIRDQIWNARVVIAVAGMEGALPSVLGGLAPCPVIAVPTSVGYGASFGGVSALLGMLNACASNVVVVNIDNGFGAGYTAALMNRDTTQEKSIK